MTFAKIKPLVIGGIIIVALSSVVYFKIYLPKITYSSILPVQREMIESISGVGTLEAKEVIILAPKTTSKISALYADEGNLIARGELLAKMELAELPANKQESSAVIEKNRAQVAAQKALLEDLRAKGDFADATLARYRTLIKGGYVTQAELDGVEASARSAHAQILNAQEGLKLSQHEIERSLASREALDVKIDDLSLRSPIDGVVLSRDAEKGSTLGGGVSVFKIADPKKIWVKVYIDEHHAGGLRVGQTALVTLRSHGEVEFNATVSRIGVMSDRITEERVVYLSFQNIPKSLPIGEQAEGRIILAHYPKALIIPANTLISTKNGAGVWTAKEGKALFQPLKLIGRNLQGEVAVSGIDTTMRVIVPEGREIKAGDKVRL